MCLAKGKEKALPTEQTNCEKLPFQTSWLTLFRAEGLTDTSRAHFQTTLPRSGNPTMNVICSFGEGYQSYAAVPRRRPPPRQAPQRRPLRSSRPVRLGEAAGRDRAAEAVPGRRAAMADEEEDVPVSGGGAALPADPQPSRGRGSGGRGPGPDRC